MNPLLADPWVAAQIERALLPYVGRLSEAEIGWMREQLAETLANDPRAAEMLGGARPPEPDQSGEVWRGEPGDAVTRGRSKAG